MSLFRSAFLVSIAVWYVLLVLQSVFVLIKFGFDLLGEVIDANDEAELQKILGNPRIYDDVEVVVVEFVNNVSSEFLFSTNDNDGISGIIGGGKHVCNDVLRLCFLDLIFVEFESNSAMDRKGCGSCV